jgi:hypothetical protein
VIDSAQRYDKQVDPFFWQYVAVNSCWSFSMMSLLALPSHEHYLFMFHHAGFLYHILMCIDVSV